MAKVTAPLMSLGASGSVGGAITFSTWKGRPYVRQLVKPANPKSPLQVSTRAVMGFLAKNWSTISAADQATWQAIADTIVASPFNAYTKTNLKNWTQFLGPGQKSDLLRVGTFGTKVAAPLQLVATGGVGQITITCDMDTQNDNWGLLIFRNPTTTFSAARDNLVGFVAQTAVGTTTWVDTPLVPATYYYTGLQLTLSGKLETTQMTEVSAAAT